MQVLCNNRSSAAIGHFGLMPCFHHHVSAAVHIGSSSIFPYLLFVRAWSSAHSFARETWRPASWACRAIAMHTPQQQRHKWQVQTRFLRKQLRNGYKYGNQYMTVEISHNCHSVHPCRPCHSRQTTQPCFFSSILNCLRITGISQVLLLNYDIIFQTIM